MEQAPEHEQDVRPSAPLTAPADSPRGRARGRARGKVAAPDVDGETPELGGGAGRRRGREAEQILVAEVAGEGRQRPFQPVEAVDGEDLAAADVGQARRDLAHLAHLGAPAERQHVERRV